MSEPLRLMFTRRRLFSKAGVQILEGLGSEAIQSFTWSDWSHVALAYGDEVIEAMMFKGVTRRPLAEALPDYSVVMFQYVDPPDPQAVWDYACSQKGKGFDMLSILGLWLKRDWQSEDRWQCAELIAESFQKAGYQLLRAKHLNRIVPQHLLMSVRLRDG